MLKYSFEKLKVKTHEALFMIFNSLIAGNTVLLFLTGQKVLTSESLSD